MCVFCLLCVFAGETREKEGGIAARTHYGANCCSKQSSEVGVGAAASQKLGGCYSSRSGERKEVARTRGGMYGVCMS